MTEADVREILTREVMKAGSIRAWAQANDVSHVWVRECLKFEKPPGPAICKALGVEKRVTYVRIRDTKQ